MKANERAVFVYDLTVGKRAAHAQVPQLSELAAVWKSSFNSGDAAHEREKGSVVYRLGDVSIDNDLNIIILLFRRCDKLAADAAYSHMETGNLRFAKKEDGEGGDTAAHVVISLLPERRTPQTYLTFVEGVPRIGHHYIQSTLNGILRSVCAADRNAFTYPHPAGARDRTGNEKRTSFVPSVDLVGHLADDFISDIENGTVNSIQLVKQEGKQPLGGNQFLSRTTSTLNIKVNKNLPRLNRWADLLSAVRTTKTSYKTARITFRDPENKQHSVELDLDSESLQQQMYIKGFLLQNIEPPLAQSSNAIVSHFSRLIVDKIIKMREV